MPNAKVMILCGNAERRERYAKALSKAGWRRVLSAPSMAEAAKMLRGAAIACAIVDVELEDIPGLKAVRGPAA